MRPIRYLLQSNYNFTTTDCAAVCDQFVICYNNLIIMHHLKHAAVCDQFVICYNITSVRVASDQLRFATNSLFVTMKVVRARVLMRLRFATNSLFVTIIVRYFSNIQPLRFATNSLFVTIELAKHRHYGMLRFATNSLFVTIPWHLFSNACCCGLRPIRYLLQF